MIPLNILIAFPYFNKNTFEFLKTQDHSRYRLMIDSGAFTAHMSGEPIQIDDYCKFLDAVECLRPFHAVQLDVIGDHDASLKNYELMKSRGYDVLPVFTRGAPVDALDQLYTLNDYVLIGGVAFGDQRKGYVKWLLPKLKNRKVHLLGFTSLDFIKVMRPYSIDTSSWNSSGRFGELHIYEGRGKIKTLSRVEVSKLGLHQLSRRAQESKLTSKHFSLAYQNEAWNGGNEALGQKASVQWLSAFAYVALAQDVERFLSTRYYLSVGSDWQTKALFNCYKLYEELSAL